MTLEPGDVVLTGTPAGVGPLHDGAQIDVEVPGVGVLTNPVESLPAGRPPRAEAPDGCQASPCSEEATGALSAQLLRPLASSAPPTTTGGDPCPGRDGDALLVLSL
jgi:hypothetical protein